MQADRPILQAGYVGPHAAKALNGDTVGKITAVFQSVIYVSFGSNLVAVTSGDVAPGPLNLQTIAAQDYWRKSGLKIGQSALFYNNLLQLGGATTIDMSMARSWSPPDPAPLTQNALQQALKHLDTLTLAPPAEGYGYTIRPHDNPDIITAAQAVADLYQAEGAKPRDLTRLLGRGPGLTPAGDDFLGGAMIGLHGIGQPQMTAKLWSHLAPHVATRTGSISAALLRAASDGMGSASLHRVMHAVLSSENLDAALAELDQIGHSSGWDAFAGLVLALRTHATRARLASA
jgi:hypothetical protein